MSLDFPNPEIFARQIEAAVQKGFTYLEAIVNYCTERQIDTADIAPYLSEKMVMGLRKEAQDLHFLKRGAELPLDE